MFAISLYELQVDYGLILFMFSFKTGKVRS